MHPGLPFWLLPTAELPFLPPRAIGSALAQGLVPACVVGAAPGTHGQQGPPVRALFGLCCFRQPQTWHMWGKGMSAIPPPALIGSFAPLQIIRTFRIETRKASKAVARRKVSVSCRNGEGGKEICTPAGTVSCPSALLLSFPSQSPKDPSVGSVSLPVGCSCSAL